MKKQDETRIVRMLQNARTRERAFGEIVRSYTEALYWKIRHIVISHEDANDVLQNTFMRAWNNISDFRGDSRISTWLYRIAINEALDFLRKSKKKLDTASADDDSMPVVDKLMADEYFDGSRAQAILHQAVASLPDVQRTVFTLRYFDDMKYSEMSSVLGTSEGALKASYHIAVKKIVEFLKAHD